MDWETLLKFTSTSSEEDANTLSNLITNYIYTEVV